MNQNLLRVDPESRIRPRVWQAVIGKVGFSYGDWRVKGE